MIGSSDGSCRLFDAAEQEIKVLFEKSLKQNGATSLDIMRLLEEKNLFVVTGHAKGHIALYEIKGLLQHHQLAAQQLPKELMQDY